MQREPVTAATPPDRWLFVGLLALIVWLPLPWGSKPGAAAALFGVCAGSLVAARMMLALRGCALPPLPRPARLALVLWAVWVAWLAFLVLPLPALLARLLSPAAATAHAAVSSIAGDGALYTLSVMPGASLDQLALSAAYACLFWLTLVTVARNRSRQRLLLGTLVIAGVAQALYGAVMTLSGLEYGFFEPKTHGIGWATGTFVNRNHLAGYLELTLAAGIALVLADLRAYGERTWKEVLAGWVDLAMSPRMRTRVMLAVMVVALVLTRSRMGNVAFFVALAVCGNLYILLRHPKYLGKSLIFFLSLFAVDLLIVSEQYGLKKVVERIEATDLQTEQRTLVFRDLVPVVEEYWLTGAGPGAFAAAFSPHRSPDIAGYYDHAHNDHLEFVIETGVIGYGILAALAVTTLAHGFLLMRRRRDPMACALGFVATMALVALGIHGLVEFNLRIPAIAATLVVLMALALSCSSVSSRENADRAAKKDLPGESPGAPA